MNAKDRTTRSDLIIQLKMAYDHIHDLKSTNEYLTEIATAADELVTVMKKMIVDSKFMRDEYSDMDDAVEDALESLAAYEAARGKR